MRPRLPIELEVALLFLAFALAWIVADALGPIR